MRIGVIGSTLGGMSASYYRVLQPMRDLRATGVDVVPFEPPYSQLTMLGLDVIYAHKPIEPKYLEVIRYAKALGIKLWFDYDDDLFNIPNEHPAYADFLDKQTIARLAFCADVITVSTDVLKELMEAAVYNGPPVHVVDNYIIHEMPDEKPEFRIVWRGGRSHVQDLEAIIPVLTEAAKTHEVHLIGISHTDMGVGGYHFHPLCAPDEYYRLLQEINPSVFINYWRHHTFNLSKSNIVWREATAYGAALITRSGFDCFPKGDKEMFYEYDEVDEIPKFIERLTNEKNRQRLVNHSREFLKGSREASTKKRLQIMQQLCQVPSARVRDIGKSK